MTVQEYLQQQLQEAGNYTLTDRDRAVIAQDGLEAFIYAKLTSKKFRKWAVDESSEQQVRRAIHVSVTAGKPLQFRYPFGGYKLWRLPTAPEVDWAEFFAVAYYLRYLAPIAAAYEPGIAFMFSSDDVIIERMDNVPTRDTDAYFASFKALLAEFRKHLPANMQVDIVRVADMYAPGEFDAEAAEHYPQVEATINALSPEALAPKLSSSKLNVNPHGLRDLSDEEYQAYIARGPIWHDTIGQAAKRKEFLRGEDKILLFTIRVPQALALGTTKTSITKFWTGVGVVQRDGASFQAHILPPTRLEQAKLTQEAVAIGLPGKNFQRIGVLH